jgi:hypothetical protein
VEFTTIEDGAVVARDTIPVTGQKQTVARGGCDGWESAEWSSVGARLYIKSERACPGGLVRTSSGLMSITSSGEWLDVRGLAAGSNKGVRVLRYESVDPTLVSDLPAEIRAALGDREDANSTARLAAGRRLVRADVIDASRQLEANVVEAWLVENGQGFRLDARDLVELADAGVPGSVTDLMIALSYPRVFAVNRASRSGEFLPPEARVDSLYEDYPRHHPDIYSIFDPWGYPPYGYGAGYGRGYGYGAGYGNYGWYPGNQVIVVAPGGSTQTAEESNGKIVNGKGYRRGHTDDSSPSPSSESSRRPDSGSSSTASGSTGSAPTSSASEGSSSSGSGRTAKPREN